MLTPVTNNFSIQYLIENIIINKTFEHFVRDVRQALNNIDIFVSNLNKGQFYSRMKIVSSIAAGFIFYYKRNTL